MPPAVTLVVVVVVVINTTAPLLLVPSSIHPQLLLLLHLFCSLFLLSPSLQANLQPRSFFPIRFSPSPRQSSCQVTVFLVSFVPSDQLSMLRFVIFRSSFASHLPHGSCFQNSAVATILDQSHSTTTTATNKLRGTNCKPLIVITGATKCPRKPWHQSMGKFRVSSSSVHKA